jgi:hypothetical protein
MQSSAGDSLLLKMAGLPKMGWKETTMSMVGKVGEMGEVRWRWDGRRLRSDI